VSSADPERQGDAAQPVWMNRPAVSSLAGALAASLDRIKLAWPSGGAWLLDRCCATPRPDTGVNERNSQDGTVHADLYCRTCHTTLAVITWRE